MHSIKNIRSSCSCHIALKHMRRVRHKPLRRCAVLLISTHRTIQTSSTTHRSSATMAYEYQCSQQQQQQQQPVLFGALPPHTVENFVTQVLQESNYLRCSEQANLAAIGHTHAPRGGNTSLQQPGVRHESRSAIPPKPCTAVAAEAMRTYAFPPLPNPQISPMRTRRRSATRVALGLEFTPVPLPTVTPSSPTLLSHDRGIADAEIVSPIAALVHLVNGATQRQDFRTRMPTHGTTAAAAAGTLFPNMTNQGTPPPPPAPQARSAAKNRTGTNHLRAKKLKKENRCGKESPAADAVSQKRCGGNRAHRVSDSDKDERYYAMRKLNNLAAKQHRARKARLRRQTSQDMQAHAQSTCTSAAATPHTHLLWAA